MTRHRRLRRPPHPPRLEGGGGCGSSIIAAAAAAAARSSTNSTRPRATMITVMMTTIRFCPARPAWTARLPVGGGAASAAPPSPRRRPPPGSSSGSSGSSSGSDAPAPWVGARSLPHVCLLVCVAVFFVGRWDSPLARALATAYDRRNGCRDRVRATARSSSSSGGGGPAAAAAAVSDFLA
eukprot:SAG25_NODE_189_length_12334_cov_8.994279_2_plen_181_part_00